MRAMTMLCQVVAKFDVRGVVPHTPSPPTDDTPRRSPSLPAHRRRS
jgi:hypothetical protein